MSHKRSCRRATETQVNAFLGHPPADREQGDRVSLALESFPVTLAPRALAATAVAAPALAMKIGELARCSGLPVKTLRYYEDLGLLPAVGRSPGGYRLFAEESLRRLEFIRRLKSLGLSLEDIGACLAVHDAGQLPCGDIQRQLQRQIDLVDERLRELRQFRKELQTLLQNWRSDPEPDAAVICPNLNV